MNTLVPDSILNVLREGLNSFTLGVAGLLTVGLLLVLIFLKEAVRTRGGDGTQRWLEVFDIALVPLMGATGIVILGHLLNALRP